MNTLSSEVDRIKNELADIGCRAMFGKNCIEVLEEIIDKILESKDSNESEEPF